MRRMLKRKIHPAELEVKIHKSDGQKQPSAVELISNVENDAYESVSLLPIQGTYHSLSFKDGMCFHTNKIQH